MGIHRVWFTLRWMVTRIAVIAVVLAFLVAAARESKKYHCGNRLIEAVTILLLVPVGRAMVRAYRWTPPLPEP